MMDRGWIVRYLAKKTLLAFGVVVFALPLSAPLSAQTVYKWTDEQGRVRFSDQPPNAQKDSTGGGTIERFRPASGSSEPAPEFTLQEATRSFPVMLYTNNPEVACEACDQARELLQKRGVPFKEKRILTEDDLVAYRMLFDSENVALPGISIGKTAHHGFSDVKWHGWLDRAGYPRDPL